MATPRSILAKTPAMLAFVADSFRKAGLAPLNNPFAFAEVQSFNKYLYPSLRINAAHR
ncbi:hypothetical protein N9F34_03130 [Alphaproteobacteria bacterium]|nr:hypothetical protein [Alphaproteobacteria bacterium]